MMDDKKVKTCRLRFKCPRCGGNSILCVNRGCINKKRILGVDEEDYMVVEGVVIGLGDEEVYICEACDYTLKKSNGERVSHHVEFFEWLRAHQMIDEGLFVNVSAVDWAMLRKQKLTLLETISNVSDSGDEADDLQGILHLLDHIQDEAVLGLDEKEVFGG